MKRFQSIFFCLMFFGCINLEKNVSQRELAFKKFVSQQRLVDLPIYFVQDAFPSFILEGPDTLFIPMDSTFIVPDPLFIPSQVVTGRVWGIYKDTRKCYIIVTLGAKGYPELEVITFDKKGNKIGFKSLCIGECNSVNYKRYSHCAAKIYWNDQTKQVNFSVRDSVLDFHYNHPDKNIRGKKDHYVKFLNGIIDSRGHISVSTGSLNLIN